MRGFGAGVRAGAFFVAALRAVLDFFEGAAFLAAGALRVGAFGAVRPAEPGERCFDVAKR
jgi:hypothetical protein